MRKSKERLKIESLDIGGDVKFPISMYVKIARVVTTANTTDRAKGLIKPEETRDRIDSRTIPNKIIVRREL